MADLSEYGIEPAPEAREAYRAQRLHELGIRGAEDVEWTPAVSSNVVAYRYVKDDPYPLQIQFGKNGIPSSVYGYVAPESAYEELLFAPSKGKHVYYVIRRAGYSYKKLWP